MIGAPKLGAKIARVKRFATGPNTGRATDEQLGDAPGNSTRRPRVKALPYSDASFNTSGDVMADFLIGSGLWATADQPARRGLASRQAQAPRSIFSPPCKWLRIVSGGRPVEVVCIEAVPRVFGYLPEAGMVDFWVGIKVAWPSPSEVANQASWSSAQMPRTKSFARFVEIVLVSAG